MYTPTAASGGVLATSAAQASPRDILAMGDEGKVGRARALEPHRRRAADEKPFDAWLRKQLHAMYDEIAAEPLPTDLINLIDRDTTTSSQNRKEQARDKQSSPTVEKDKS